MTEISLPDGLERIGSYTFAYCTSLTEVVLPANLKYLGSYAFAYCTKLVKADLGGFIGEMDGTVWTGCTALEEILGSDSYIQENGIIYSEDKKTLVGVTGNVTGEVVINPAVEIIEDNAFKGKTGITSVTMSDNVHTIGANAFDGCSGITSLKLSQSLKRIGDNAFNNCSGLPTITIPSSVIYIGSNAFYNCYNATNITLGTSVKNIGASAFYGCQKITELTIPESVTSIGNNAFYNAIALTNLYFNAKNCEDFSGSANSIFYRAGYTNKTLNVVFGEKVGRIPGYFYYCDPDEKDRPYITSFVQPTGKHEIGAYGLAYLTMLNNYDFTNVTGVDNYAFYNCTTLTDIDVTFDGDKVGNYAFYNCTGLKNVNINVKEIGEYTFGGCTGLQTIILGDRVEVVGRYAFTGCTGTKTLTLGEGIKTIHHDAFYNLNQLTELYYNCNNCGDLGGTTSNRAFYRLGYSGTGVEVIIGDNVERLPNYLFYPGDTSSSYRNNLISVDLGSGLKEIGKQAFYYVISLVTVTGGENLELIGDYAFCGDTALQTVEISPALKTIGQYAFNGCTAMNMELVLENVDTIGVYAFSGCSSLPLIEIGDNTKTIGTGAFSGCTGVKTLTLGKNIENIGSDAFYNLNQVTKLNYNLTNYKDFIGSTSSRMFYRLGYSGTGVEVVIGDNVERLPNYLFYPGDTSSSYRNNLISVDLGSGLKEIGKQAFYYVINLVTVTGGENLELIGDYAFCGDTALKTVAISPAVKTIGQYAFNGCTAMNMDLVLENVETIGIYAFSSCSSLPLIEIGDNTKTIGTDAFSGCTGVKTLTLGKNIENIGSDAFYNLNQVTKLNYNLTNYKDFTGGTSSRLFYRLGYNGTGVEVVIGDNVERLPNYLFYPGDTSSSYRNNLISMDLGSGVKEIGKFCCYYNSTLTTVTGGENLYKIGEYAFGTNTALKTFEFAPTIQQIEQYAFNGCTLLTGSLNFRGLKTLGYSAFYNCSSLTSVDTGDILTTISGYAFGGCSSLSDIRIGKSVTSIETYAFYNTYGLTKLQFDAVKCKDFSSSDEIFRYSGRYSGGFEIIVGDEVTTIPASFMYISSSSYIPRVLSVTLGKSVETIGASAFYANTYLNKVTLNAGLKTIGDYAFYNNSALKSLTVPKSVETIRSYGIYSVPSGYVLYCYSDTAAHNYAVNNSINYALLDDSGVTGISITDKPERELHVGESIFLHEAVTPANLIPDVSWTSSKETVATVDHLGRVTAVGAGTTEVTVTCGTFTDTCTITVVGKNDFTSVVVEPIETQIYEGIAATPHIIVYLGEERLIENIDYQVAYSNNDVPGTASYTVTGMGTYEGVITGEFEIICLHKNCSEEITVEPTYFANGTRKYICPLCGYSYTEEIPMLIDANAPTGTITVDESVWGQLLNVITFGIFFNSAKDVTIEAVDTESGIQNIQYFVSDIYLDKDALTEFADWKNYSGSFMLTPGDYDNCIVYARMEDKVGNVSYISTDGFVFDAEVPLFTGAADGGKYDEAVTVKIQDDNLDTVTVNGENLGCVTEVICEELGDYTITAVDKAGNTVTITFAIMEEIPDEVEEVASGWSGSTQWTLTDDGVITFYGSGNMKNYGYGGGQPWLTYADEITSVVIENGVTGVGSGAFMNLIKLETVTLPETGLAKIGEAAFYGCTSLKDIDIPDSVFTVFDYTFKNCSSLTNVRLSKQLIKVGQGAFENCTSLSNIFIPSKVEIIGFWSFKGCTGLEEADMQWADATEIREGAFKNCSALTTIILPENIQTLGDSCFYGIGATSITIPETVTSVEPWCFARANLEEITFVGDAPTIGEGAFNKISLTAYYPDGNETWTSDVMLQYGGTITWKTK